MNVNIYNGKEAYKLYIKGEDRLEYLAEDGTWRIFDDKFHRVSKFIFYDRWRVY